MLRTDTKRVPNTNSPCGYFIEDTDPLMAHWKCDKCGREYQQRKRQPKSMSKKGEAFKEYILGKLNEYIKEAEHQDGEGFWDNFADLDEAFDDFLTYWENHS